MPYVCDGYSVASLITAPRSTPTKYLTIERSDGLGWAFVAGHRDPHGTLEQAVRAETNEEVGLTATRVKALHTATLTNLCSAPNSTGHEWTIYEVETSHHNTAPDPAEVSSCSWLTLTEIETLAETTIDNLQRGIPMSAWRKPFWEAVQILWVSDMRLIRPLTGKERKLLTDHVATPPSKR